MNRRQLSFILLVFALVILLATNGTAAQGNVSLQGSRAFTAVGSAFTYQGRFTEAGQPANGFFDFEFKLFNAQSGGSQVGNTRAFDNRQVTDGLLTVDLDFGTSAFNGEPRWLEIGVRSGSSVDAYTILTPRQALTPAPYAIYAGNAPWEGLSGVPAGFVDGVDNDTTYSVGDGLSLNNTQISLDTTFTDDLYWSTTGNAGLPATNFLGTTDNFTMTLGVNDTPVMQLGPNNGFPAAQYLVNRGGRGFGSVDQTGSVVRIGERYRDNSIYAWGRVSLQGLNHDQVFIWADFGVDHVSRVSAGYYRIHLTDFAEEGAALIPSVMCELEGQPTSQAEMRIATINQVDQPEFGNKSRLFYVYITDGTGTAVDNDFVFMVTGR